MKKHFLLLAVVAAFQYPLHAQNLLEEHFNYASGDSLTGNNWTAHSSASRETIKVNSSGLSFSGYTDSGNAALINPKNTTAEDLNRSFSTQNSGTVYASFLINAMDGTNASDDYSLHFNSGTATAKVAIKKVGGMLRFALSKRSSTYVQSGDYALNTTYLLVLKYHFLPGSSNDDEVSLYIFDTAASLTEPAMPTIGPLSGDPDASNNELKQFCIRQFSTAQHFVLDEIRIATTWNDLALPVSLLDFTAKASSKNILVSWSTATEEDNAYFTLSSSTDGKVFRKIREFTGAGTSTGIHHYTFQDEISAYQRIVYYEVAQTDRNGSTRNIGNIALHLPVSAAKAAILNLQAIESAYQLSICSPLQQGAQLQILDLNGRLLQEERLNLSEGYSEHTISVGNKTNKELIIIRLCTNTDCESRKIIPLTLQ